MTQEQLDKMTPDEKRKAIGTICGLPETETVWMFRCNGVISDGYPTKESAQREIDSLVGFVCSGIESHHRRTRYPDYLNDLNAMHEAENLNFTKPENAGLANAYRGWLVNMNWEGPKEFDYSASERADAFLLTLG